MKPVSYEAANDPNLHFLYTVPAEYLVQLQVFKTGILPRRL